MIEVINYANIRINGRLYYVGIRGPALITLFCCVLSAQQPFGIDKPTIRYLEWNL